MKDGSRNRTFHHLYFFNVAGQEWRFHQLTGRDEDIFTAIGVRDIAEVPIHKRLVCGHR